EASDLIKIKEEIDQLKDHLIQIANTAHAGRHIFSGYKTDMPLLVVDEVSGEVRYNEFVGDLALKHDEIFTYNVGLSEQVQVNTVGIKVFGVVNPDGSGNYGEVTANETSEPHLIKIFEDLSAALENNIPDGIQQALGNIEKSLEQTLSVRAEVGAKMNRLELTEKKLEVQIGNVRELLSYNEDVDIAEISMHISMAENVYVSSLMVGAKIIQPTLVEFLR
ncbi:MAG: flagellar hook-associated protein FlgL, partial [Tissierellia bacterium]|nr:flagellar hook-associated protein FlgL [Tissierellia bacterium]